MSQFRNPIERYNIIHGLLTKMKGPTWRDIAESYIQKIPAYYDKRLEQVKRIVYQDIESLRNHPYNAPIDRIKMRFYYDSSKPPFSLFGVLNKDEVILANEIMVLLKQYAEFPMFKGLENVQLKINSRFDNNERNFIEFDENKEYRGLDKLHELYESIKTKKVLKIIYGEFSGKNTSHSFSPYMLKEYNNRWHIYGWNHLENEIFNFPLDRIKKIEQSNLIYREFKQNDLDFLKDLIGFTWKKDYKNNVRAEKTLIIIKVKKERANYLDTKPLHSSQEIIPDSEKRNVPNYVFYSINVYVNNELISALLSYGDDLEVMSPPELRTIIKKKILKMSTYY
ncbi:helix-turn-helix transcriptional regulator [Lacihabitans lacunae]|uniref:Helix-turn-helix transcriptional regulator n=1 Tax=Lacihabitans lacunae TaxID=1028214 RepID=A0ABV7YRU4_9BACT